MGFVLGLILAFAQAPNVHVYSCQLVSGLLLPQRDEIGLAVRFENRSADTLNSIVWRAKYGSTWIDFIDDGSFSPQTRIDNFILFEAGKRKFNWLGAVGDAVALGVHAYPSSPLWNAPSMFANYASYDDPDNCAIARTISSSGDLWVNPALTAEQPFAFPSPSPSPVASPSPDPSPAGNIAISDCEPMIGGNGELTVRFTNLQAQTATRITFRVPYKDSGITFTDAGTFSTGAAILHNLKTALPDALRPVAYVPFADPRLCQVVTVQYADGTVWQNAMLGAPAPLPTPVPEAIDERELLRARWKQLHGFPTPLPSVTP